MRRRLRTMRLKRFVLPVVLAAGIALVVVIVRKVGLAEIVNSVATVDPAWIIGSMLVMTVSPIFRGVAWREILRAAFPGRRVDLMPTVTATLVGILAATAIAGVVGEATRAGIVARRMGNVRETLPAVLGTLFAQTLLNILALLLLTSIAVFAAGSVFGGHWVLFGLVAALPFAIAATVYILPRYVNEPSRMASGRVAKAKSMAYRLMIDVREGLEILREPRHGAVAAGWQFLAWALQWVAVYMVLIAFHVSDRAGLDAAAAVLFAVNVIAVVPLTPSNLGVYQAVVVAVLTAGYGVSASTALGCGILLQAAEFAAAIIAGVPALMKEGLSFRQLKEQAMRDHRSARGDAA